MSDPMMIEGDDVEQRRAMAFVHAALVYGYNELAKQARTFGDKMYFRLLRNEAHRMLNEMADTGVTLEAVHPEGLCKVCHGEQGDVACPVCGDVRREREDG